MVRRLRLLYRHLVSTTTWLEMMVALLRWSNLHVLKVPRSSVGAVARMSRTSLGVASEASEKLQCLLTNARSTWDLVKQSLQFCVVLIAADVVALAQHVCREGGLPKQLRRAEVGR